MQALVSLVESQHNVRDGGHEADITGGISCVGHQQEFPGLGHKVVGYKFGPTRSLPRNDAHIQRLTFGARPSLKIAAQ